MRTLDLFAGIGGFSIGLERAGFKAIAFSEIDPYASRVLAARFPSVPNIGDVTKAEFPKADFITAGFPCQDISNAGQRAGITGSRSGLYGHVVRALRMVRPRGALLENVAALLNRGLGTVLGDLAAIGYDAEWHCIPASAVGAPHRRDRIWIIANPRGEQHEGGSAPISGEIAQELLGANAASERWNGCWLGTEPTGRCEPANVGEDVTDSDLAGSQGRIRHAGSSGWWATEPNVGRVAHGVPARVDRLRCLGNAIVPQVAELIGRAILAAEQEHRRAA